MVCFDYEVVRCSVCGVRTQDGYQILDDKVVCDECGAKTRSQRNENSAAENAKKLPWPSDAEAKLLCMDCLRRFQEWDRIDMFEPCPKCQALLDAQMAPDLVRIRMPGENSTEGDASKPGRAIEHLRSASHARRKTRWRR